MHPVWMRRTKLATNHTTKDIEMPTSHMLHSTMCRQIDRAQEAVWEDQIEVPEEETQGVQTISRVKEENLPQLNIDGKHQCDCG